MLMLIKYVALFKGNDDTDDTESHDEADDEEMVANHSIETI